ncbi:MAG: SoxR reducing system RseC family protein [Tannerellaceae bacterium]|jgi:sigma-E factor negative regulatory protein RseC|nr:SoxR reducing system RseC family protein [Tannerellaceae bacterium]
MKGEMRKYAVVERVVGDKMIVRVPCESACGGCVAGAMCSEEGNEKKIELSIKKGEKFTEGETVLVSGRASQGIQAVFIAFVWPMLGILVVTAGGLALGWGEAVSALGGLLFAGVYFGSLYIWRGSMEKRFELTVQKQYPL